MGKKVGKQKQQSKQKGIKKGQHKTAQVSKSNPSELESNKNEQTLKKLKSTIKTQRKAKNGTNNESEGKVLVDEKSKLPIPAIQFSKQKSQYKKNKRSDKNQNNEMVSLKFPEDKQNFSINFRKENKNEIKNMKKELKKLEKQKMKAMPKQKNTNRAKRSNYKPSTERQQETNVCPSKDTNGLTNIGSTVEKEKPQKSVNKRNIKTSISKQKEQEKPSQQLKLSQIKEKKSKPGRSKKLPTERQKKSNNSVSQGQEKALEKQVFIKQVLISTFAPKSERQHKGMIKNEFHMGINESVISQIKKPVIVQRLDQNQDSKQDKKYQILVEGISTNSFEGDIRDLFSDCGAIMKVKLTSKKKKKYATVQFFTKDSLSKALLKNGVVYMGKVLTVSDLNSSLNKSLNRKETYLKQESSDYEQDEKQLIEMLNDLKEEEEEKEEKNKSSELEIVHVSSPHLIVSGFSEEVSFRQIKDLFSKYGNVISCQIKESKNKTDKIVEVHVQYETALMAEKAKQNLNNGNLYGNKIKVETNRDHNGIKETIFERQKKKTRILKEEKQIVKIF